MFCFTRITNEKKAAKIMNKFDPKKEEEIETCCNIDHENLVKYLDYFHVRSIEKTFLIMEYCEVSKITKIQ